MFTKDFKEKFVKNKINDINKEMYMYLQSVEMNTNEDIDITALSIGFLIKKIAELEYNVLMFSQTKK